MNAPVPSLADPPRRLRALLALVACAPILIACAASGQVVGSAPTQAPTEVASPPSAAAPTRPAPSTAIPTSTGVAVGEADCVGYLGLVASTVARSAEAALSSYRCSSLYVDSTGRYPPPDSALILSEGDALSLRLTGSAGRRPDRLEVRLYSGAGVVGSFLRWPEEFLLGVRAVDSANPPPSLTIQYAPQAPPGVYSLVVLTSWSPSVDVFYAVSLEIAPSP